MIELIAGLLSSATGGGLFGILGSWLKGREEHRKLELQFQHEQEMRRLTQEELRLEAELAIQQTEAEYAGKRAVAETEADAAKDVAASELMAASYTHDRATYGGGFVDAIRGAMRPLITTYLLIVVSIIAYKLFGIEGMFAGAPEEARDLLTQVVNDVVFLAVTATTWWFGTRPNSQRRRGP